MKQLLVFCGLTIAVFGIMAIGIITIGRSYPPINLVHAAGLDYCGAQVCLHGVALGTDWKNAMEKLTPSANFFGRDSLEVITPSVIYDVAASLIDNQFKVGQIASEPNDGLILLLGDVVGQYGAPCLVSTLISTTGDVQITINYPTFAVVTPRFDSTRSQALGWKLAPQMPLEYVDFNMFQDNCAIPGQLPTDTKDIVWHGFTSF